MLFLCAAYPELHPVQTYYAVEVGQPVTMQCAISPGKLIQRYTCVWRNSASPFISVGNTNYPISYEDFSLTIIHATLSNAGTDWHCHVTVDNPQTSHTIMTGTWRVTASHWLFTVSTIHEVITLI